jgi:hypothetical protein
VGQGVAPLVSPHADHFTIPDRRRQLMNTTCKCGAPPAKKYDTESAFGNIRQLSKQKDKS